MQKQPLLATLLRGAGAALGIQMMSVGLNYSIQVLFARWMGATEYGTYEYVMTVSTMLGFLAGLGLPNVVLRFVSEYTVKQDWARLRGMIWGSWWQTFIASVTIALCGTGLILWFAPHPDWQQTMPLLLGMWTVPLVALTKLQLEMVRSLQQITLAYAPSLVLYPLVLLASIGIWYHMRQGLTSITAIALSMLGMLLVLVVQFLRFQQALLPEVHHARPVYALRQWLMVALPLLFIDGSFLALNQTDNLMIAALLGTKAVGIYSAAFKTAGWVNFILVAVNAIAAPLFASLYAQGDRQELQRLVSTIAQWMFYPALIAALGLIIFAEPVLQLFGTEFVTAKWAMVALALGQLVNVGSGSVGYLLMMTGHHNQCAFVMGCSALINVFLNFIGIPWLGVSGAAIATAISMSLWNLWLNALVVKYLGVNPSIVAAWRSSFRG